MEMWMSSTKERRKLTKTIFLQLKITHKPLNGNLGLLPRGRLRALPEPMTQLSRLTGFVSEFHLPSLPLPTNKTK